jgi:hypothetical protein
MGDFSGNLVGATFQNNIKQRKQIGKWKEKHGIALAKSAQDPGHCPRLGTQSEILAQILSQHEESYCMRSRC